MSAVALHTVYVRAISFEEQLEPLGDPVTSKANILGLEVNVTKIKFKPLNVNGKILEITSNCLSNPQSTNQISAPFCSTFTVRCPQESSLNFLGLSTGEVDEKIRNIFDFSLSRVAIAGKHY